MPMVKLFDVLAKTSKAVINGTGFDVFPDQTDRTVMLVDEYDEDQIQFSDQEVDFCADADGTMHAVDDNQVGHMIDCYRLVPVTMEDL